MSSRKGALFLALWVAAVLCLVLSWRQSMGPDEIGATPGYASAYGQWAGQLRGRR